jgi:hypothetical protein
MASVKQDSILASVHGSVGGLVIVHNKGRVWTRTKPAISPKATPRRKVQWRRLGQASQWASAVLKEVPDIAARYREAAKGTEFSAQQLLIADFMHKPVIEQIDLSSYTGRKGETIRLQVRDDVKPPMKIGVAEVRVVIRDLAQAVVEKGNAVQSGDAWLYTAQTDAPAGQIVNIEVTATDQPNNHATKTAPHFIGWR